MPFYEYIALDPADQCDYCKDGFEELQKVSDEPVQWCPRCGAEVRRKISAPAVQAGDSHRLDPKHFSKHGFTQYKRAGSGVYEKTGGKGPRYISDD
ncbi:MAG: zinc ribbon domain-containing protein [Pseudomonadota bacterium]